MGLFEGGFPAEKGAAFCAKGIQGGFQPVLLPEGEELIRRFASSVMACSQREAYFARRAAPFTPWNSRRTCISLLYRESAIYILAYAGNAH